MRSKHLENFGANSPETPEKLWNSERRRCCDSTDGGEMLQCVHTDGQGDLHWRGSKHPGGSDRTLLLYSFFFFFSLFRFYETGTTFVGIVLQTKPRGGDLVSQLQLFLHRTRWFTCSPQRQQQLSARLRLDDLGSRHRQFAANIHLRSPQRSGTDSSISADLPEQKIFDISSSVTLFL